MFSQFLIFVSSYLITSARAQGLWDYGDYNSLLFPPAYSGPSFQNQIQRQMQRQIQPPHFPPNRPPKEFHQQNGFRPQSFGSHRLGSASYRLPANANANSQQFGSSGSSYYTGRGNDYVGSSAEQRALSQDSSNRGDLDGLLARIVTKLPVIADQLSHIMTTTQATPTINPNFWLPFVQTENLETESDNQRRAPSSIINSMPDPAAFFSFGKLLSAFTGSGLDSSSNFAKQVDPAPTEERSVDVESVKGIPILKDEDQEPVVVQRTEDELPAAHSLESNESHQTEDETTSTPELIIFTLPTDTEESTTIETTTKSDKDEDSGNLLGNLLSGKKVDWIGSIFGSNKRDKQTGEDGNALAQLFGNGFFGSAMNDDDSTKRRKHEDRNFFLMS